MASSLKLKVHFMGIGGSGMSAAAALAKNAGYEVDGCDLQTDTPYISKLKNEVKISPGHSAEHVKDKDILVVTPAVYFTKPLPDEVNKAKKVMTWQSFLGKNLAKGREVISVAGTHGKSTTTALLSLVFEKAMMNPTVMVGAKISSWGANYRIGKSNIFMVEGDEFYDNFLNYTPHALVLNNIEFDHPDYFKNEKAVTNSFRKHIKSLTGKKVLVYNSDSPILHSLVSSIKDKTIKKIGYSLSDDNAEIFGNILSRNTEGTVFQAYSKKYNLDDTFSIKLFGDHNVSNALGVIAMSLIYSVAPEVIKKVFSGYSGLGRRMELLGNPGGIYIYDDYAHHPTKVRETLKALRQKHPAQKLIAVVEPHSYSRTKSLLANYKGAFEAADRVIIAPIFWARDNSKFGVDESSIIKVSGHKNISFIKSFEKIISDLEKTVKKDDVIIVMGAGESYKLSRGLVDLFDEPEIQKDISLAPYTTFGIGGRVSYLVTVKNESQLKRSIDKIKSLNLPLIALGKGSNVLIADNKLEAVVLRFAGEGITKTHDSDFETTLHIEGGALWDEVVRFAVENNLQGIECMSGIPGTMGAAPVQNIGAYGQEIKDVFVSLEAFDLNSKAFRTFSKSECEFGYRDSVFKNKFKSRFLITSVNLSLKKNTTPSLTYGSLVEVLKNRGIDKPTISDVRKYVLEIRKEKFGSLTGEGTAGSFFKNPVVSKAKLDELKKDFPDITFNEVKGGFKLFAGWLIENAGWKGKEVGNVGVNKNNALVIVKLNDEATAVEILKLSREIQRSVKSKFGIVLEREVNLLGFKDGELR